MLAAARATNLAARVVYIVVLARLLGPELYGLFAYGTAWYLAFLPLSLLGLDIIAARAVGTGADESQEVVDQTRRFSVIGALFVALLSVGVGWLAEQTPLGRMVLTLFAVALVGRAVATWADGMFVANERAGNALLLQLLLRPLEVAVGIAALLSGGGLLAVVAVHAAIWWLQALVGGVMVARLQVLMPRGSGIVPAWRTLLVAALPLGGVEVLQSWFLNLPIVQFRQGGGGSAEALGQLSLALQALMVTVPFGTAVAKAALPVLSRAQQRADGRELVFAEAALEFSAIGALFAWLLLNQWGQSLVAVLFGPSYAVTGELLPTVFALLYPYLGAFVLTQLLALHGVGWPLVLPGLIGIASQTLLQWLLVPRLGVLGVVLAMAVGFATWMLLAALLLRLRSRFSLGRALIVPWALGGALVALYWWSSESQFVGSHALLLTLGILWGLGRILAYRRRLNLMP